MAYVQSTPFEPICCTLVKESSVFAIPDVRTKVNGHTFWADTYILFDWGTDIISFTQRFFLCTNCIDTGTGKLNLFLNKI